MFMLALYSSSRFMPNAREQMLPDMAPGLIGFLVEFFVCLLVVFIF